jgi:hypothetical protein
MNDGSQQATVLGAQTTALGKPWAELHDWDVVRLSGYYPQRITVEVPTTYRRPRESPQDLPPPQALEVISRVISRLSQLPPAAFETSNDRHNRYPAASAAATEVFRHYIAGLGPDTISSPCTAPTSFEMPPHLKDVEFSLKGRSGPYCFDPLIATNSSLLGAKTNQKSRLPLGPENTELRMDVDCDKHIKPYSGILSLELDEHTGERTFYIQPSVTLGNGAKRTLEGTSRSSAMCQQAALALADPDAEDFEEAKYTGKITSKLSSFVAEQCQQSLRGMRCSDAHGLRDWSFTEPIPLEVRRANKADETGQVDIEAQSKWLLSNLQQEHGFESNS